MRGTFYLIKLELERLTGLHTTIMPRFQVKNEPELTIFPKGLTKTNKGISGKGITSDQITTANELHFDLELKTVAKSENMLFEFYNANEKCNEIFINDRLSIPNNTLTNSFDGYIYIKKILNGGQYWVLDDDGTDERDGAYILTEKWECLYKFYSYK